MISTNLIDAIEVQFNVNDVPNLSIPASISALRLRGSPGLLSQFAWEDYAIEIIQAAVVWLIVMKLVKILKAKIGHSILSLRFRTQTTYLLSEDTSGDASCEGWLEQEILRCIALRDSRRISDTSFPGAFIDKMVWSLIGSFQPFPPHRVVHSVQFDAQRRGWGTSQGLVSPRFQPAPDRLEELECEQQKSRSLVEVFGATYPEFNRALIAQIRKGLRSRLEIPQWDTL